MQYSQRDPNRDHEHGRIYRMVCKSKQFHDRADGLAMWVSDDGKKWTKVWESKKPVARWSFDLAEGTKAKFVKLALTKPGIFHLNQAVLYGRPLER